MPASEIVFQGIKHLFDLRDCTSYLALRLIHFVLGNDIRNQIVEQEVAHGQK